MGSFISSPPSILLQSSVSTASGNPIDVTNIPSNAKRIVLGCVNISTNGSQAVGFQIGDSGGIENTGYLGSAIDFASNALITTGFFDLTSSSAITRNGTCELEYLGNNYWSCSWAIGFQNTGGGRLIAATKQLSGTLDRFRLTTASGGDTFDGGTLYYTIWG